jgi:type IV pilus assembly protein PilN
MIRINLLPRDEIPTPRNIEMPRLATFAPLVLVLLTLVGLVVVSTYQASKVSELETLVAQEEAESRRLAPEIAKIKRLNQQREDLNQRLDVITSLDRDRYFRVQLLDELNRALPEHMWLTRFEETAGDRFTVEGVTFSNFQVSDFLQNLDRSPHFAGVTLTVAERGTIEDVKVIKFKAETTAIRQPQTAGYGG